MANKTRIHNRDRVPVEVPYVSKVVLPARRAAIVRRQRLIEALAQSAERRITVVSAPAGYGKTTLLLDFAQSWGDPVCCYAIDERDREMDTFLRYFVACGQAQFPAFGAGLAKALQAGQSLSPEEAIDLMVAAVQSPSQRYLMVLDDFHFLDDAPGPLRQAMDGWLYRLPPNCHVVLSGRTQPQLSVLPLMSVRQEVGTIAAADFSFTCDEVAQLFRDVLGKEIVLDDAQHLADLTEGWAAALVLMADKAQLKPGSISLEQLRGSDTLFQYIAVEQFNPLPDDVKQFLTGSAVPRTIEPEFVNEFLGITDTEEKLNFLSQRNLLVLRDEHDAHRHRYHRLFRAFLVSHLRAQDPQRFQDLNLRAAAMRAEAQEWEDAVYHYIQAADWDSIVQVTEKAGWRLFEEGRWDTLAEWLEAVPAEEMASQPRLILWKARILQYLNQVDRALALLAQATASFEKKQDHLAVAEALVTKGMCLRRKGDYAESKQVLARARSLFQEYEGPVPALTEARKELGITLGQCGEFAKALDELKGALEVYEAQGDAYNIAEVSQNIGNALMALGRLPDAAAYLERARQRWTKLGNEERLVQTLNNLGMLYFFLGDYDQAEGVFRSALEKLAVKDNPTAEVYLHAALGDIRKDRGDYKGALDLYKAALERGGGLEEAYIRIYILDAIANAHRLTGDVTGAQAWAQQAGAEAEERGGVFEAGLCRLTLGLIQRDRGQLKEAVASLEQAAGLLQEAMAHRELASAHFLLAGVYFSLKRKSLALEFLAQAAAVVKELGYDHFLRLEASRAPLLIQYAAANKIADGYYAGMLKTLKGARQPAAAEDDGEQTEQSTGPALYAYGFGNLRVEFNGREVTDLEWRSEKGKEMFFFFLGNRRPLRKEEIVAALWPDLPEDKTTSAFHSNMYRLRKALYQEVIAKDSGRYILNPRGRFVFDVEDYQGALREADARKGTPEAIALMEKALELYKGQFAPDFYTEWAETLRWQMEEQYMSLLATLAAAYNGAGEFKRSADLSQRVLELDEFNEGAWYRLMSNYIQSGQTEAAKYCYNRYVQIVSADGMEGEVADFDELCREVAAGRTRT